MHVNILPKRSKPTEQISPLEGKDKMPPELIRRLAIIIIAG